MPDLLDNTPWWLPDVTTGGGDGVVMVRCSAYEQGHGRGPAHLEGGFYDLRSLGPHAWFCRARSDGRYRMVCACGHKGQPQELCNGHRMMIARRGSGVCPPCAHPPAELEIQEAMTRAREGGLAAMRAAPDAVRAVEAGRKAEARLWDLQAELDELVARGIVHRCGLRLEAVT